jgi:hypothetical protein
MGDKVRYAIVKREHTIKKRILTQNTVFNAEQSAIFEKNNRNEIVIITDSLSTTMAAENRRRGFQKERPKKEKRKQRYERKEAGRRQKEGYERNAARKEQVAISRLRTRYTRASHGPKMEGVSNSLCPFCNTYLTVNQILWKCKEIEFQGTNMDMRKEQWINRKKV